MSSLSVRTVSPLVAYDAARRRVWIAGQRCHHGATGALLAAGALCGLAAARVAPRLLVGMAATGGALMAHDWKDRRIWFARGPGDQP